MRAPLRAALRNLGLALRDEWLVACDAHLRATHANFDALPPDRQARRRCCSTLLHTYIRSVGAGR
jgi:hypothetical protein